jgi:hypothetical protein
MRSSVIAMAAVAIVTFSASANARVCWREGDRVVCEREHPRWHEEPHWRWHEHEHPRWSDDFYYRH